MNVQVITKTYVELVIYQSNLNTITIISYIKDTLDQIKLILVHYQALYILF